MQFARINDITLHYQHITAPEGSPVLVFSNSLATDFRIWRDVIVRLVGKAEIITYDNRGIADSLKGKVQDSDASLIKWGTLDMPAVLETLKLHFPHTKYFLIGHSAGGQLLGLMPNVHDLTAFCNFGSSSGSLRNMRKRYLFKAHFFMNLFIPLSNLFFGHTKSQWVGMGEPLLNFDAVTAAMKIMMDDKAYGLSKRKVTLSTSGLVPLIDKLGEETDAALTISLHAPNDELRDQLVPINKKYPIKSLLSAVDRYVAKCGDQRKTTIEYILINKVNDKLEHAEELTSILREMPCKINLIPFNPFFQIYH